MSWYWRVGQSHLVLRERVVDSVHKEVKGVDVLVEGDVLHPSVLSMKQESMEVILK